MRIKKTLGLSAVALLVTFGLAVESNAQQQPSDAIIGAIVLAANQIDIDYAKIAVTKSKNKEVREFGFWRILAGVPPFAVEASR